jgi:predicted extracellular nuclease
MRDKRFLSRVLSLSFFLWGTCLAFSQTTELFISEYVEGSGNNKAIELYNGTGSNIDLSAGSYSLAFYANGSSSATTTINLTGTAIDGDVYVVRHSSAALQTLIDEGDQTDGSGWYNGDDAVALLKAGVTIDVIGQIGTDPGSEWGSGVTGTKDNTLRRKADICAGDPNGTDAFDPSVEWDGFAQNTVDGIGSHTANCAAPSGPAPLLLTEIVVTPTAGEFVEIHNPGTSEVDLSNYYLTDATYSGGSNYYYNIVTGSNTGGGSYGDFLARFPDGATIPAGGYQTVALNGADDFNTTYGVDPTYELYEDNGPDSIPNMREGISGSISGQGGLTNNGEIVILFYWDGASDLVADVDYAVWGDKAEAVDKTGVSVDGPDADSTATTYLPDTDIPSQDVVSGAAHSSGESYTRIDLLEGTETLTGGNGVDGNDETSENLSVTWGIQTPTPNAPYVPSAPSAERILLTEIVVQPTAGEFIEIYNPGSSAVDLSNYYITDATYANSGVYYYNIVTGANAGGGTYSDFHARFPDGASIAAGEFQTISLSGSDSFNTTYGVNPTYELYEDGTADAIPDMREAITGSINDQGGLTNNGEVVVLYYWDGSTDLVTDVDYAIWGDTNEAVDKTGISVDGPDADATGSSYQNDTAIASQDLISASAHDSGMAYVRVDFTEGTETQTGGNGVAGNDETSENLSVTWVVLDPTPNELFDTGWVINEFQADPDSSNGDANGDGTSNTTQDEFVEIFNNTGADVDVSGWTLSDGYGVRHTFPAGTTVPDQCVVVVFGGGTPTGDFGDALVQTASTGSLGLNNSGDSIIFNNGTFDVATVVYGSEGGNNQSLTLDPDITGSSFVQHSAATGSSGALFSPGTMINGDGFSGCAPVIAEIFEIQGNGTASPYNGLSVIAQNNVVTAVTSNGFMMQTPAARDDLDDQTSNGIYVYTGAAPGVLVGDLVDVSGDVVEFYDFTEFTNSPVVTVLSSGNALPAPVTLDSNTPSGDPVNPSCMECLEGMLVTIPSGTFTSGNQYFGSDHLAEAWAVARTSRSFREAGIEYPGVAGLPVWDGNPELFEMDLDRAGLPSVEVEGGETFNATGVVGFEYGDYEVWPTAFVLNSKEQSRAVRPVRDRLAGEITVGSQNLYRLFTTDSNYADRLNKFSLLIRTVLKSPDVIAFQEVGGIQVLQDLAAKLHTDDAVLNYTAYLEVGNDIGGIEVGFLVRDTLTVNSVVQIFKDVTYTYGGTTRPLHDRPPLILNATYSGGPTPFNFLVMVVHNRSLNNIDDPSDGDRVRTKRDLQATDIANYLQTQQAENFMVVGDFNGFEFTDGYVDVLGQITGNPDPLGAMITATDVVNPNMHNLVLEVPANDRYSYVHHGTAQVLDHALANEKIYCAVKGMQYGRTNADFAKNSLYDATTSKYASDHDGLVVYLQQAGIIVDPVDGLTTTENGAQATFTVVLSSAPSANVSIAVSSSDATEGTADTNSLVFTPANWNVAQTVTVTGQSDSVIDGDITYQIMLASAVSTDSCYSGIDPADVELTNLDASSAGVIVTPVNGLVTDEYGSSDQFTVSLNSSPSAEVTVPLSVDDASEIALAVSSLTFTSANWNTPQTVTVSGVDDGTIDSDTYAHVVLANTQSADANYQGLNPQDVEVLNQNVQSSDDYSIHVSGDCVMEIQGPPNGTVGIYTFDEATQTWVFLMNVTLDGNGFASVTFECDPDTVYGAGSPDDIIPPDHVGFRAVPTLGTWGLIFFALAMILVTLKTRRR